MGEGDSKVTFNVSGQQQGNINMAGRDMHVGTQIHGFDPAAFLAELNAVRSALDSADLPPPAREAAEAELAAAEEELAAPSPDKQTVADRLTGFTTMVKNFGGLATAGAALFEPLRRMAEQLGPVGHNLLRLLT
jgi:hypothetical protein